MAHVNSVHHHSVGRSPAYLVSATAPDGVVEAIEVPGGQFCVGLQWHPEYDAIKADASILSALLAAAARRAGSKERLSIT